MRIRSSLLAGVAGLAVAAFAGSALAQQTQSWGSKETTYFNSEATTSDFGRRVPPAMPSAAAPVQPGDTMEGPGADMRDQGASPGVTHGRSSEPTLDSAN